MNRKHGKIQEKIAGMAFGGSFGTEFLGKEEIGDTKYLKFEMFETVFVPLTESLTKTSNEEELKDLSMATLSSVETPVSRLKKLNFTPGDE